MVWNSPGNTVLLEKISEKVVVVLVSWRAQQPTTTLTEEEEETAQVFNLELQVGPCHPRLPSTKVIS